MKYCIAVGLLLTSISLVAADRVVIQSHKIDRPIVVDGDSGEWQGPLVPLGEQHPVAIAVANDAQNLYVVLTASDAATRRQIMREGLIVWFDPGGKDKKHYGIKFPVGAPIELGRFGRGGRGEPREPREPGEAATQEPRSEEPVNRLEILGPGKDDAHNYVLDFAPGVSVKLVQAEGSITYELKVPLATSADVPYAVGAKPGATIGLGLETPKRELPKMEGEGGRGMGGFGGGGGGGRGGGGMGGRGGGMGGGRGGGRGGEGRGGTEPAKPMKVWATVHLTT